jgi:hypothetical protein
MSAIPSLLALCEGFYRQAALLKVPETLLRKTEDFVLGSYYTRMIGEVRIALFQARQARALSSLPIQDPFIQNLNVLLADLSKRRGEPTTSKEKGFRNITVPIDQVPYIKDVLVKAGKIVKSIGVGVSVIDRITEESGQIVERPYLGLFTPEPILVPHKDQADLGLLYLGNVFIVRHFQQDANHLIEAAKSSLHAITYYLDSFLAQIKMTVRHELQHLMQTVLRELAQKSLKRMPEAGLPKGTQQSAHNQFGHPIEGEEGAMLPHALRTIEFYPNLTDNIEIYRGTVKAIPLKLHRAFLSAWIAEMSMAEFDRQWDMVANTQKLSNDQLAVVNWAYQKLVLGRQFFESLKTARPLMYREAVKQFVKAVS